MSFVVINESMFGYIDDLFTVYPDVDTFYFEKGVYKLIDQMNIEKENIRFIGLTNDPKDVHIVQEVTDKNAISITADNFVLNYISVHVQDGSGVCISHAGANWTNIESCHFYGSNSNFTIYFAGPVVDAGQPTLDVYINNQLDQHNVFDNNIVYTKWAGDAVSFSLQRYGSVRDNIIRGGKIAIYMVKDCITANNRIFDSQSHGIICSQPSKNVKIMGNIIKKSAAASINVRVQAEHAGVVPDDEKGNIIIRKNKIICSKYFGIEINGSNNLIIDNNVINDVEKFGVYLLKSSNNIVSNNLIVKSKRGVHIDIESIGNHIINNKIYSVFPNISDHAVNVLETAQDNIITENTLSGTFLSSEIKNSGVNTTISDNNIELYHTYKDELLTIF